MGASLSEILPGLNSQEPRPPRLQTQPPPVESLTSLYAQKSSASFFLDGSPHNQDVNHNVLAARDYVLKTLAQSQGTIGSIEGSMGAGKTTLLAEIAGKLPQAQVFRHSADIQRFASSHLVTQSDPRGHDTGISAQNYSTATDLLGQIEFSPGAIVVIDEWHFAQAEAQGLIELVTRARAAQTRLIFAQLNTDFARRPWPNALLLQGHIDSFRIVLAARCSTPDCHQPGLFTTRQVTLANGRTRPAHTDEDRVQVGSVSDAYSPACAHHHQVWIPQDAYLFDAGYSPIDTSIPVTRGTTTFWSKKPRPASA